MVVREVSRFHLRVVGDPSLTKGGWCVVRHRTLKQEAAAELKSLGPFIESENKLRPRKGKSLVQGLIMARIRPNPVLLLPSSLLPQSISLLFYKYLLSTYYMLDIVPALILYEPNNNLWRSLVREAEDKQQCK